MIKSLTFELRKDFSLVKRNIKYIFFTAFIGGLLIIYNSNYVKLEEEITSLKDSKVYLQAKNVKLKTEVAKLSSPERISKIAKRKLKMKKVNLKNVKFLNSK